MVGSALIRRLEREECDVLTIDRAQLDLRDQAGVAAWLRQERPDLIFLAAAKVGGIVANRDSPAEFLHDNLVIGANVIEGAHRAGVRDLLFLGSSCIYPKLAPQPITEECLLSGALEPTNEWYAIAKIADLKMCQAYRRQYGVNYTSVMPTNLYGPGDNFSRTGSHVLPALMLKIHEAAQSGADTVGIWGTGTPRREFLHADDLADACVYLACSPARPDWINVGAGEDITISELAALLAKVIGFDGRFIYDHDKPDGAPRKLLDVSRLTELGWTVSIPLEQGVSSVYQWFLEQQARGALRT